MPTPHPREMDAFLEALEKPSSEQAAYLEAIGSEDALLRERVERLLHAHHSRERLRTAGAIDSEIEGPDDMVGRVLGNYEIRRFIAAGGMGAVYEAEQRKPKRRVALKLVHPGFLTERARKRLEDEAEILGRFHHQGIARILEAGTADLGAGTQPFFVLELIEGKPLNTYARDLPVRERVALFERVTEAVGHAHQRGVIHRDLKPDNILVEQGGQPKVLDFGIARLEDDNLATRHTRTGEVLGTLSYMSPEQVEGDPTLVGPRTDLYALGVLLYEITTGSLPFDLDRMPLLEAARTIREVTPQKPSSRNKSLPRDLDAITLKALEKDPARRYPSTFDLGEDLRRFLRDEPVLATPPSKLYVVSKLVRRHRTLVLSVVAIIVALLVGLIRVNIERDHWHRESIRATDAESKAQQEKERAQRSLAVTTRTSQFLQRILIGTNVGSWRERPESLSHALDLAASMVEADLEDDPAVAAEIHEIIGSAYGNLARLDEASFHLTRAHNLNESLWGPDHPDTLYTKLACAAHITVQGDHEEGLRLMREALERAERLESSALLRAQILVAMAPPLLELEKDDEAQDVLEKGLSLLEESNEEAHSLKAVALNHFAFLYRFRRDERKVLEYLNASLAIREAHLPPDHPDMATMINNIGHSHMLLEEPHEALDHFERALSIRRGVYRQAHPRLAMSLDNLACLLRDLGELDRAEPRFDEALSMFEELYPEGHVDLGICLYEYGTLLRLRDELDEALSLHERAYELRKRLLGEETLQTITSEAEIGRTWLRSGEPEEAEPFLRRALAWREKTLSERHTETVDSKHDWGVYLLCMGRLEEATETLRAVLDFRRRYQSKKPWLVASTAFFLAVANSQSDQLDEMADVLATGRAFLGRAHQERPRRAQVTWREIQTFSDILDVSEEILEGFGAVLEH